MLEFKQLRIIRGNKELLSDANLTIFPHEKVGLIGQNGAGKTSLLSAILGELSPEQGVIVQPKQWRIATISQELPEQTQTLIQFVLGGDSELQAIEQDIKKAEKNPEQNSQLAELYQQLGDIDGYTAHARAATLLHGLGFKDNQFTLPLSHFSGGWQMRAKLARVLGSRAELLILDEPTNHLDLDTIVWLENWLKQIKNTVIVVSHDRDFLDTVCSHCVHLHNRCLTKYTGGYSKFEQAFAQKQIQIEQSNKAKQADQARLQLFISRFKAKASKAKQAQSRVKRLEKIQLIETLQVETGPKIFFPEPDKQPDPLISVAHLDCGYNPQQIIVNVVNLEIRPGDRIGLLGANGNGKTTLVKTLVGLLPQIQGSRTLGNGLKFGYFAQNEIDSIDANSSPLEHLKRIDPTAKEESLRSFLARFNFGQNQVHQLAGTFSGGEKSRLALAQIAYQKPNLLLLDEPTNHLDIPSRQSLASSLIDFPGALLTVSHDRHLLESISDYYLWVHDGKLQRFEGSLEDYAEALKQANQAVTKLSSPLPLNMTAIVRKASHQELKQIKNQVKKIETQMAQLEQEIQTCEVQIANLNYLDPHAANLSQKLSQQKASLTSRLESLEIEYLNLLETLEQPS